MFFPGGTYVEKQEKLFTYVPPRVEGEGPMKGTDTDLKRTRDRPMKGLEKRPVKTTYKRT